MKLNQLVLGCTIFAITSTGFAKQEKTLICHVGNEARSNGETYLDDPDCVPTDANAYFCPDAGKIDLIIVAKAHKHLENDSHSWGGISDYEPSEIGASGDGTEDGDGNGIDDGCEPPVGECPCWNAEDLIAVTAENQQSTGSCSNQLFDPPYDYPRSAFIQNDEGSTPDVEGGFAAYNFSFEGGDAGCGTRDTLVSRSISESEADACIDQIATRCDAIGDPIVSSLSCPCWSDLTESEMAALLNSEEWSEPSCGGGASLAQAIDQADQLPYLFSNHVVNSCHFITSEREVNLGGLSDSEVDTCISEIISVSQHIDACP